MKRPRSSITTLSLFATIALSPCTLDTTLAALHRNGVEYDDENDSSLLSTTLHNNNPDGSTPKKKTSLIVNLSTSTHPRASSSSSSSNNNKLKHHRTVDTSYTPQIPLIGIGVGNIPHNRIPYILASATLPPSKKKGELNYYGEALNYRLIDTSHTDSALEVLVGRSLSRLSSSSPSKNSSPASIGGDDSNSSNVYHVMIKIWHTHLGYERTMLSVQDSLSDILPEKKDTNHNTNKKGLPSSSTKLNDSEGGPDIRIHAILQYPRCYNELFTSNSYLSSPNFPIKYTSCQEEEDALDDNTKLISGTSPLMDKENAWKRSYRALEELYHHGTIESIGISNFGPSDLEELFDLATVGPHIYQGSLRTLLSQNEMIEMLVKHGVHYQCYDVASTIMNGKDKAHGAYQKLERLGAKHNGGSSDESSYGYSPVQVVLGWLVHHRGVGVIPGTTDASHLAENSPSVIGDMPRFTPREVLEVEMAVLSLVKDVEMNVLSLVDEEEDFDISTSDVEEASIESGSGIVATFFNSLPSSRSVKIFQIHPTTGEQIQISHAIPSGRSGRMIVNVNDVLVAYDGHGVAVKKFLVEDDSKEGEEKGSGSVDFTVMN